MARSPRKTKNGTTMVNYDKQDALERLCFGDFNIAYIRGLARTLLARGETACLVYRADPAYEPRKECTDWEGQTFPLADVCPYLEQLPAGERSTYAGFLRWVGAQGRTPPSKYAAEKHGGWNRVRRLAQVRIHPGLESENTADEQASTGRTRARTPEPRPPEPGERLRALNFRSPARKTPSATPEADPLQNPHKERPIRAGASVQTSGRSPQI